MTDTHATAPTKFWRRTAPVHGVYREASSELLDTTASLPAPASLGRHAWRQHCRGLFQTPIAA
jgi:hypothetical protein